MTIIRWLISRTIHFFLGSAQERRSDAIAKRKEAGTFEGRRRARAGISKPITPRQLSFSERGSIGNFPTPTTRG